MDSEDHYRVLGPLLQGLAHEIRNPIQGILASADAVALRFDETDQAAALLQMIQRECVRINGILGDLLDLVRPIEIPVDRTFPFHTVLEEAIRNFRLRNDTSIQIASNISTELPNARIDVASLHRAIAALLQNASESRPEGVSIQLTAKRAGSNVHISIRDNGEGIEEANRERVLQPFFSTRPRKAGLGLPIADRVVRLHGGHMQIDSTRGSGTSITIFLPAQT